MCNPVAIGTAVAGVLAAQAMAPQSPKMPEAPPTPQMPQTSKAPERQAVRGTEGGTAASAAPQGTMLTGPEGVAPGALNLGKNVLLGG